MKHSTRIYFHTVTVVLTIFALAAFPNSVLAYHGGNHFDLTRECLLMENFSPNAIQMVQASNWYDDAYDLSGQNWLEGAVAGGLFPPQGFLWEAAGYFHFTGDENYAEVLDEWNRLETNTYAMIKLAEGRNDVLGLLVVMGASLHWMQDFYAHSNWADLNWGGDATWFDISEAEKRARVESGEIEIYTAYGDGARRHEAINMDNASSVERRRPYEKGYREAFYATCQWVKLIRSWVSPDLWEAVRTYSNPRAEAEATWDRKMMWYAGTWKGNWSKSSEDVARIALLHEDFPGQNKWEDYAIGLARGVAGTTLPARRYEFIEAQNWLVIEHNWVTQTDCSSIEDIDPGGLADFYAKVRVDEHREYLEAYYEDRDTIGPSWVTIIPYGKEITTIHLEYTLWDDEGGTSDEDHCDIAYERNGVRDWVWDGSPWKLSTIDTGAGFEGMVVTNGLQRCDCSCVLGICYDCDSIGDGDEARVEFEVRFTEQPRVEIERIEVPLPGPIEIPPDLLWTDTPVPPSLTPVIITRPTKVTPIVSDMPTKIKIPTDTPITAPKPSLTPTSVPSLPSTSPGPCSLGMVVIGIVFVIPVLTTRRLKRLKTNEIL